jgi:hypothetical protein
MKNLIIATVFGTAVMAGGFWYGMRIAPKPVAKPPTTAAAQSPGATNEPGATPAADAISVDTLKKTSEEMMTLNQALQDREKKVAEREQKVAQQEDEIRAEREALDRSHDKFKTLFNEFQSRLQLVEANQAADLQKQSELYTTMNIDQSIDLIRAMDDDSMTRLFSVMDTKPLSKLVAAWKVKYPNDSQRLLRALDGMSRVLPKDQIALSDPPASTTTASPDSTAPAATPDSATPPADANSVTPAPGGSDSPQGTPADSPAPADSTPAPPDSTQTPVSTATTN